MTLCGISQHGVGWTTHDSSRSVYLLSLFFIYIYINSKHHKSPYTTAANVLCVIGFILNFTVPLSLLPALFAMITVLMTICIRVPKQCLWVAVVLALLSSICAFVVLAAVSGPVDEEGGGTGGAGRKTILIMSIFGGLVWMGTTYLIYKIPAPDATNDVTMPSSDGPSSYDDSQV